MAARSNIDDGVLFSFDEEVAVGAITIQPQGDRPPTHPCGRDCRWFRASAIDSWSPWIRCVHSSVAGIASEGRECPFFAVAHSAPARSAAPGFDVAMQG